MDIDDFDTQVQCEEVYDSWLNESANVMNDVRNPTPEPAREYDPAGDGWGIDDVDLMLG
jgi:hypothetical protein